MSVELTPTLMRTRFPAISWPAIFAALAVGIAVQLLLSLAGLALGVYALDSANDRETITLAAASWSALSMLIAAIAGGYIAGRGSGLRRTGDGVLHGVVAWAATTLLYTALATTASGALTTGLFGLLGSGLDNPAPTQSSVGAAGDRERALQALTDLGISANRARAVLDELASPQGNGERAASRTDAVGSATLWLSAAVLLSLLLAIVGGTMGVRGGRRVVRHGERMAPPPRPRVLSRT